MYNQINKNKKFTISLYNDKKIFNYLNCKYLTYHKNSCWIDCFIMLYIFIFKKFIVKFIMENNDNIFPPTVKILNEFTDAILQEERNNSINFFDLYNKYSQNYYNNFLEIDIKKKVHLYQLMLLIKYLKIITFLY